MVNKTFIKVLGASWHLRLHVGTQIGCSLSAPNILYKPEKVQNGVGPTSCIVSASIKCLEEQYSDVLSVYVIRTNTAEELGKNSNTKNSLKPIKAYSALLVMSYCV